jgi:hypothetical protein
MYPREYVSGYDSASWIPIFIVAQFTIARLGKHPRCPTTDEWIRKMWYVHTMECYSAIKKDEICCLNEYVD